MTAIDFPSNPSLNDEFTASGRTWIWNGSLWNSKPYADDVVAQVTANIVDSAPAALDTLNELAAALGDDANFATTVTTALGNKQDKVSGVSDTEIGHLDGVTSAIQTQLNGKAAGLKIVEDKTTNYTIVSADNGKIIRSAGSGATTFTIADVLATGESIEFIQSGTGLLTFAAGVGVTLNSYGLRTVSLGRNSRFIVTKSQAGTYVVSGDLAAILLTTSYLVVAGGGGGGVSRAAGGGAGGYREGTVVLQQDFDYQVLVGGGGAASGQGTSSGNASMFDAITSAGGGFGGGGTFGSPAGPGGPGGSGGGGAYGQAAGAGNTPAVAPSQGNNGASTGGETGGGGGGANAGGSGQTGGAGRSSSITGTAVFRGGGGGGGGWPSAGPGGIGGGGAGTSGQGSNGGAGVANTGGGGGGMSAWSSVPGNGGSGIVILNYPAVYSATLSAGLTGTTTTVSTQKVTQITAGTGTVRFTL